MLLELLLPMLLLLLLHKCSIAPSSSVIHLLLTDTFVRSRSTIVNIIHFACILVVALELSIKKERGGMLVSSMQYPALARYVAIALLLISLTTGLGNVK